MHFAVESASEVERDLKSVNYWIRFDVRSSEIINKRKSEIFCILYPEIALEKISFKKVSFAELQENIESTICFQYLKSSSFAQSYSRKLLNLIAGSNNCEANEYFSICDPEGFNPTSGIYWSLWVLIINRVNRTSIAFSGGACD